MNDMRAIYETFRHTYRRYLREDAKWRPDPYANRQQLQVRPDRAGQLLENVRRKNQRMAAAMAATPAAARGRLPRTGAARWYANWRPETGRYANLTLSQRRVLRQTLRRMAERHVGALSFEPPRTGYAILTERLEAETLKSMALRDLARVTHARLHNLPH